MTYQKDTNLSTTISAERKPQVTQTCRIQEASGIVSAGRGGLFQYNNLDSAIESGIAAGKIVVSG